MNEQKFSHEERSMKKEREKNKFLQLQTEYDNL